MRKFKKIIIATFLIIIPFALSGCNLINSAKLKLGIKNEDFEYMKSGRVSRILIESTRDKGFKFIVEDKKAISDLYELLSSAKKVSKKSYLKSDYTFIMYENDESVHSFQYVAGVDNKDGGNLYDDKGNIYIVSKRVDNDIIKNFSNIRKPKKFQQVYYESIVDTLKMYLKENPNNNAIGIDLLNDVEMNKYMLSVDIENFKNDIKNNELNANIINNDEDKYKVVMNIKTQGYKPNLYKAEIKLWNKEKNEEKVYYVINTHKNNIWKMDISSKKPENF